MINHNLYKLVFDFSLFLGFFALYDSCTSASLLVTTPVPESTFMVVAEIG
jgi:hypothetical protein